LISICRDKIASFKKIFETKLNKNNKDENQVENKKINSNIWHLVELTQTSFQKKKSQGNVTVTILFEGS